MKRVLVTGSSRGIGLAIANQLKGEGYGVTTLARTDADILCDLSLRDIRTGLLHQTSMHYDILINNAGGNMGLSNPFEFYEYESLMQLNFLSAVNLSSLVLPYMEEKNWGRVINVCSTSSLENNGNPSYCSAKAALAAYTRSMGRVLAPTGVVMSGLIVGAIKTEGGHFDKASPEHVEKYVNERLPAKRFMTEQNVADMVSFLCKDESDCYQGALIPIDAGQSRHFFGEV